MLNTTTREVNTRNYVPPNDKHSNSYLNTPELKPSKRLPEPSYTSVQDEMLLTSDKAQAYRNHIESKLNPDGTFKPESTDSELIFNWDSSIRQNNMMNYQQETSAQLQFLDQLFNDTTRKTNGLIPDAQDYDGKRIINNTADKQWFKEYVALVFSIGCIFNQNDQTKLNEILKVFENSGDYGFLMNYHKVLTYEDPLIQAIEKKMEIGNGNYHLFLVPIVQTTDPEILAKAPEQKYSYSGTVDKYCEWNQIYTYMQTVVARYGLLTPIKPVLQHKEFSDKQSWEIGMEGLPAKTVRHNEVESKFDIDIDPDDENQIRLNTELEFRHEQDEHFKPRVREVLRARASENDNPTRKRYLTGKSLYARIAESNESAIQHDSTVSAEKGVQLKMNESIRPPQKRQPEYQLYEDDSTYQDGINVMSFASDHSSRQYMPTFQHLNKSGARTPNHQRVPQVNRLSNVKQQLHNQ